MTGHQVEASGALYTAPVYALGALGLGLECLGDRGGVVVDLRGLGGFANGFASKDKGER